MKNFILVSFLFIIYSNILIAQNQSLIIKDNNTFLSETIWITNQIVGFQDVRMFYLVEYINGNSYPFGYFIQFNNTFNFKSFNRAPCGNDCFISLIGDYSIDNNYLIIKPKFVTYGDFCNTKKNNFNKSNLKYEISQSNNTLYFKIVE
jgi:hypothetical protein